MKYLFGKLNVHNKNEKQSEYNTNENPNIQNIKFNIAVKNAKKYKNIKYFIKNILLIIVFI